MVSRPYLFVISIAIALSVPGCEGQEGPQGPQGSKGEMGSQGIQGPQGLKDDQGPPGTVPFAYVSGFLKTTTTNESWVDLPQRVITYEKQNEDSVVLVTMDDTFGTQLNQGANSAACAWRLLVDDVPTEYAGGFQMDSGSGFRFITMTTSWTVDVLSASEHEFQVQYRKAPGALNCFVGGLGYNSHGLFDGSRAFVG